MADDLERTVDILKGQVEDLIDRVRRLEKHLPVAGNGLVFGLADDEPDDEPDEGIYGPASSWKPVRGY